MAVAIKITQAIKNKNKRYNLSFVKNNPIGSIIKKSLPNKFYVTEPVSGGYANRIDLHSDDGWGDIIIPPYNTETQKLGTILIESDNDFTYKVFDLSQEEIIDLKNEKRERRADNSFYTNIENGRELFARAYRRMNRRYIDDDIAPANVLLLADVKKFMAWNRKCFTSLSQGDYYSAETFVVQTIIDKDTQLSNNTPLKKMFEWLRNQIQDYIANEYDLV